MEKQLKSLWEEIVFFNAINVKNIDQEKLVEMVDEDFIVKTFWKKFTNWEIGCALSHLKIYEEIIEKNIESAIICEDDIVFDYEKFKRVLSILNKKNDFEYVSMNYDLLDIEFRKKYIWNTHLSLIGKIIKFLLVLCYRPIELIQQWYWKAFWPSILSVLKPLHLTWCYYISNLWARKILETSQKKIRFPADYIQNIAHKEKHLQLHFITPLIAIQENEKFKSNTRSK